MTERCGSEARAVESPSDEAGEEKLFNGESFATWSVDLPDDGFTAWRRAARNALHRGIEPQLFHWHGPTEAQQSLLGEEISGAFAGSAAKSRVPKRFLRRARQAAQHRDPKRWQVLYRLLWRLNHGEPRVLEVSIDDDVRDLDQMVREVRRDVHKTRAFVRFRRIAQPGDSAARAKQSAHVPSDDRGRHKELDHASCATASKEPVLYVAWHRSDHDVLPLTADFFVERFNDQSWVIHTPCRSASWDGRQLRFGPGLARAPEGTDELEELWGTYYSSIFNPARVNLQAMRAEMPRRYWSSMPETALIPSLVREAPARVESMLKSDSFGVTGDSARALVEDCTSLQDLRERLPQCRACGLCEHATQVVPGVGSTQARLMLIGEAPGDHEDLAGRPFVGPAGLLLRAALEDLGVDLDEVYLTNAVKHFKFEVETKPSGRTRGGRIHKTPAQVEVSSCWPWLRAEIEMVRPQRIVCLGATAARAVIGGEVRITRDRGRVFEDRPWAPWILATYHPAHLLRSEPSRRGVLEDQWLADLSLAARALTRPR